MGCTTSIYFGAGIERLKTSKTLEWGSPLLAAQTRFPFEGLHLCEKSPRKYKALSTRISRLRPDRQILRGDANEKIGEIVDAIPKKILSLAFLDPYGLHLEYETLKKLSDLRADLVIFFPDHLDALRNWGKHYPENAQSNLDRGLAGNWRSILDVTAPDRRAEVLRELYVKQLCSLGYTEFEYQRISTKGHPLHILIFCSRSKLAARLWRGISSKESDSQRRLPFEHW